MDRNVNNELISGYSKKKKEKKDILDPADHVNVTFSLLLKRVSKKYSQSSRRCAPKSNLVDCGHILSIKLLQVKKKTLETFIFFSHSFQQRQRHFYVARRGPKCLIFHYNRR
jgi:hypothetical protein